MKVCRKCGTMVFNTVEKCDCGSGRFKEVVDK